MRKHTLALIALVIVTILAQAAPAQRKQSMVASQNAVASQIGADVMKRGGNAIDAAIATAFAMAVTHPTAGNIGGGGFMVIRFADGRATTFDFREKAPLAAFPEMFLDEKGEYSYANHHDSHRAVGVPGTVAGLWKAHGLYGSRPWAELVAPAVALARDGFIVTEHLASSLARMKKRFSRYPGSMKSFYRANGDEYGPGDVLRQPDLAATLQRIQEEGRDGFYRGTTADLIVKEMKRGNGLISLEDLARYEAVERPPVRGTYRGWEIIAMGPPSSGGITLINMLNMLETFPVERDPARRVHLLAEIMRRGYADRARNLGDPDFNPPNMGRDLVTKAHGKKRAATIPAYKASKSVIKDFTWRAESDETTHFSVVDSDMNAVSLTYTLEFGYGSGIVVQGAGFLLNNEMGDFNPKAGMTTERGHIGSPPNLVAPGKRMLSSMTPTICVRDGWPRLVVGTPGGRTIINTVFQIISNVIDLRLGVQDAVNMGRVHHQWFPDELRVEESLASEELLGELKKRGHAVRKVGIMGSAQCIQLRDRRGQWWLEAGVDPRRPDAGAAGF